MSLKNNSGFTVIELLTVIALLGILAGIAIVSMGNPRGFQSLAEAEALKANLRFTQSKAMSDLPGNMWSLNITSSNYQILRNGVCPGSGSKPSRKQFKHVCPSRRGIDYFRHGSDPI